MSCLPLTELEPLPGTSAARLLALDRPGIPSQQSGGPQLDAMLTVGRDERPGDGEAQRAGLSRLPATVDQRADIESAERVGRSKRLLDVLYQGGTGEVVTQRPSIHIPLTSAGGEVHPRDTRLAATHRLPTEFRRGGHAFLWRGVTE